MRPTFKQFLLNRIKYGECSSWALWRIGACENQRFAPDPSDAPKFFLNSFVRDLNKISSESEYESFAQQIQTETVLVALNFAERDERTKKATQGLAFHAFHEETSLTSDHRLRDACLGTPLWGSYITDLVKFEDGVLTPVRDSKATNIKQRLRNQDFLRDQVHGLCTELSELGCVNPTIVALGNDVYNALTQGRNNQSFNTIRESLGTETRIIRLPHYSKAAGISHHNYVAKVYQELSNQFPTSSVI